MRRLASILALAAALIAAAPAHADPRRGGRGAPTFARPYPGAWSRGPWGRGPSGGGPWGRGPWGRDGLAFPPAYVRARPPAYAPGPPWGSRGFGAPYVAVPPRPDYGAWRRGQRLPPSYGDIVGDWGSRHLRRPPAGFHWVQIGGKYMLVSQGTGLIFDVAPVY